MSLGLALGSIQTVQIALAVWTAWGGVGCHLLVSGLTGWVGAGQVSAAVTFLSEPPQGLAVSLRYAVLQCGHHGESCVSPPGLQVGPCACQLVAPLT